MDAARPSYSVKLLSLQETARRLGVSVETLLDWNEHDILIPTISKNGTIGYPHRQIDYFQEIQKSLQHIDLDSVPLPAVKEHPAEIYTTALVTNTESFPQRNHSPFGMYVTLCIVGVAGALLLSQGSQVALLFNQFTNVKPQKNTEASILGAQTSKLEFNADDKLSTSVDLGNDRTRDKNLQNAGKNISFTFLSQSKSNRTNTSTPQNQAPTETLAALEKTIGQANTPSQIASARDFIKTSDASTLSPLGTTSDGLRIDLGSLAGKNAIKNDTMATTVGVGILGIMFFVLQSQLAIFGKRPQRSIFQSETKISHAQKIIEIEQKMDGSVVAVFQGKEYKISKPELYSDSDQLIERLMELTLDKKEIEYDSFTDARLRLSTPLSRIVTRLNFVGLKRDLFFPRTSKNRVLFRRYITYQDLMTMNLTINDVVSDLTRIA